MRSTTANTANIGNFGFKTKSGSTHLARTIMLEDLEALLAMETTRQSAEARIQELIGDAFSGARIYQGGGSEVVGNDFPEVVPEAAENAVKRLYPQFNTADHPGWEKVFSLSRKGSPDALKAIGKNLFKVESTTVTTVQRIQIRKLFQKTGIKAKPGEELSSVTPFLQKMGELAEAAGGEAPKPELPETVFIDELRLTAGNEQLLAQQKLTLADQPRVELGSADDVLSTLGRIGIDMFVAIVAAIPARFANVAKGTAELCEPEAQFIQLPRRTLKTEADIDTWVEDVKQQLKDALHEGPVVIR